MVGVIDKRRERHGEFAAIHIGLEILAGEEDPQIVPSRDARDRRVMAGIGIGTELRREHGIEHDFRILRQDEIVFVVDEGEESGEIINRETGPEKEEANDKMW